MISLALGNAPRAVQYEQAWADLNNRAAHPNDRAHSKCFLTYRAVDGEVSMADWQRVVEPVCTGEIKEPYAAWRWKASQACAEFYLQILRGGIPTPLVEPLPPLEVLTHYPGYTINWLRCANLVAYDKLLRGDKAGCITFIQATIDTYMQTRAQADWQVFPLMLFEARRDWFALCGLLWTMNAAGHAWRHPFPKAAWVSVDEIKKAEAGDAWIKCMIHLRQTTQAIW